MSPSPSTGLNYLILIFVIVFVKNSFGILNFHLELTLSAQKHSALLIMLLSLQKLHLVCTTAEKTKEQTIYSMKSEAIQASDLFSTIFSSITDLGLTIGGPFSLRSSSSSLKEINLSQFPPSKSTAALPSVILCTIPQYI